VSRKSIGIVDYGVGNHTSVQRAFQALNYRCRTSSDPELLAENDLIVLPGVGAYPAAMSALHTRGLVEFLREQARGGQPMIGLCLGMQLLADESLEHGITAGLGLIPGQVVSLEPAHWHIGWNTIEVMNADKLLLPSDGERGIQRSPGISGVRGSIGTSIPGRCPPWKCGGPAVPP